MADEEDYLDLVIAGELVSQWLMVIDTSGRVERVVEAVEKLKEGAERSEAYIEEALEEDALTILKRFLKRENSEWKPAFGDVERIVEILEEHKEKCGSVVELKYGAFEIRVREGALLDGLGARLWNVAHSLNQYLVEHPELANGKKVLEIGSGCGSTGILVAKMSEKSEVFLTDCVPSVLENLRTSCRLNVPQRRGSLELACVIEQMNDDLIESTTGDGESLDGADDLVMTETSWDVSNMFVRSFDWQSDTQPNASSNQTSGKGGAPQLEEDDFDLIVGCEVLYEESHSTLIASVLDHRLRSDGVCLIAGAIREKSIYDAFKKECEKRGLKTKTLQLDTPQDQVAEYEGGIVLITITHQSKS